jgi:putative hydrolase of the HAD superfamily
MQITHQHYSFDLWLTLIRSHPEHTWQRATYFFKNWNPQRKSLEEIEQIVRGVDRWGNHYNELTGHCINHGFMFGLVLQQMGVPYHEVTPDVLTDVKRSVAEVFSNYPPALFDAALPARFEAIRAAGGSINLSSNTGFANGHQLRPILDMLGIGQYFNFFVFSDEIHHSKPDIRFFEAVWNGIQALYPNGVEKTQVLHVGDNPLADERGGNAFGFHTLLLIDQATLSLQI